MHVFFFKNYHIPLKILLIIDTHNIRTKESQVKDKYIHIYIAYSFVYLPHQLRLLNLKVRLKIKKSLSAGLQAEVDFEVFLTESQ